MQSASFPENPLRARSAVSAPLPSWPWVIPILHLSKLRIRVEGSCLATSGRSMLLLTALTGANLDKSFSTFIDTRSPACRIISQDPASSSNLEGSVWARLGRCVSETTRIFIGPMWGETLLALYKKFADFYTVGLRPSSFLATFSEFSLEGGWCICCRAMWLVGTIVS